MRSKPGERKKRKRNLNYVIGVYCEKIILLENLTNGKEKNLSKKNIFMEKTIISCFTKNKKIIKPIRTSVDKEVILFEALKDENE